MKTKSNWLKGAVQLCSAFGPEDGIDPRYLKKHSERDESHKASLRLCSEVSKTLALVLAGDVSDPLLQNIDVIEVKPIDNSRILVVIVGHYKATDVNELAVLMALSKAQGVLRCAIARSIHRKYVPALRFKYVGTLSGGNSYAYSKNNQ